MFDTFIITINYSDFISVIDYLQLLWQILLIAFTKMTKWWLFMEFQRVGILYYYCTTSYTVKFAIGFVNNSKLKYLHVCFWF